MSGIAAEPFGTTKHGEQVMRYTLDNGRGMRVQILNYGCTVQSVFVPDRRGTPRDVVLGYDTLAEYEAGTAYFGAFVGRCANRIRAARFSLNGTEYRLEPNEGEHHLHGVYPTRVFSAAAGEELCLFRVSPAGEEGYPGALHVSVRYRLRRDNALEIRYEAETDADTVVNFTNHSYFNLNGQDGSSVRSHELTLAAGSYTPVGPDLIPTGEIRAVDGTALDLRSGRALGEGIDAGGYDHNLIPYGEGMRSIASLLSRESGITLEVSTTEPGVQLYTANEVQNERGKGGAVYPRWGGVCLETQHFPASPAFPQFPSVVLRAGERFQSETVYRFGVLPDAGAEVGKGEERSDG